VEWGGIDHLDARHRHGLFVSGLRGAAAKFNTAYYLDLNATRYNSGDLTQATSAHYKQEDGHGTLDYNAEAGLWFLAGRDGAVWFSASPGSTAADVALAQSTAWMATYMAPPHIGWQAHDVGKTACGESPCAAPTLEPIARAARTRPFVVSGLLGTTAKLNGRYYPDANRTHIRGYKQEDGEGDLEYHGDGWFSSGVARSKWYLTDAYGATYYLCFSMSITPPLRGWLVHRSEGVAPPPTLSLAT
jgi:hypothetical protein